MQDEDILWSGGPFTTSVRLEVQAEIIIGLWLAPRRTRLTDALAVVGRPEAFVGGSQATNGVQLVIYYPQRGVVLAAGGSAGLNPSGGPATAGLTVEAAFFTQPTDLTGLLSAFHGSSAARQLLPYVQPWPEN